MKPAFIPFFMFFLFILTPTFGQSVTPSCGSDLIQNQLLQSNPTIRQQHDFLENLIYQHHLQGLVTPNSNGRSGSVVTLPVVVHVIHNNGPENIPDAQVNAAIQQMNDAFANIGYYDSTSGVDTYIRFCLAKQTPQGGSTTGIVRVQSPLTEVLMSQDMQLKNLSRWNPLCYINIWVVRQICNQNGCGVAGYAYLPSAHGLPQDGIVVEANYFGSSPGNNSVTIHEMGHYLGLYHTFQGGCTNNNCLLDGDRVCDTPPDQSTAAIHCNGTMNSCSTDALSGFATDVPDLHRNYMDYGYPSCFNMFTQGQSDRMNWHVTNIRHSLLNCTSCNNPCTTAISALFSPSNNPVNVGTQVVFSNQSINAVSFVWKMNGQVFSNAFNPAYTFASQGTYIIRLEAQGSDPNCQAFFSDTITVVCGVSASFTQSSTWVPVGGSILFTNTSTGAVSYQWFVDGNVVSTSNTTYTHQFNAPGTYPVFLVANGAACSDTSSVVNFIHVGDPCNISFTYTPAQPTTCLPVIFTPDTSCPYNNYYWTFCEPDSFGIPDIQDYSIVGTSPANTSLIRDQQGNYFVFYSLYNNSATPNTVYRMEFGQSLVSTPTIHALHTPGITAVNSHGVDVVYAGGQYYGFALYYSSIYRLDFGTSLVNDTPSVTLLTGISPNTLAWGHKIEVVQETNTWWLIAVARNSNSLNLVYLGNSITNQPQSVFNYLTCSTCSGFSYQKINGNHYVYAGSLFSGIRLYSFGNSLANTPVVGNWHTIGTGYVADLALYQNCDGTLDGIVLKENTPSHSIIRLDSISANPVVVISSFNNGAGRSGGSTRLHRTQEGLTMFAVQGYTSKVLRFTFPDCGLPYSTNQFPPPVFYPQAGNYYVRLAVDEGLPSQQVFCLNLTVNDVSPQTLNLGPDTVLCAAAAYSLDAGTGFNTYLWDDGSSDPVRTVFGPGLYWVEVVDSCQNVFRDSVNISLDAISSFTLADTVVCPNGQVMLNAPAGFASYQWTPATGLSCANCPNPVASPSVTTIYTLAVTNSNGCTSYAGLEVEVVFCAPLTIFLESDIIPCHGGSAASIAAYPSGGSPAYQYLWNTGQTTSAIFNVPAGFYSVTVTDASGVTVSAGVTLTDPLPFVVVVNNYSPTTTCYGYSDGFISISGYGGTPAYSYLWSNGFGGQNPTNLAAGTYSVTMTDANGCTATNSVAIQQGPMLETAVLTGKDTVYVNQVSPYEVTGGFSYWWLVNGNIVTGQGTSTAQIGWTTPGQDWVHVIVSFGACSDTLSMLVTILDVDFVPGLDGAGVKVYPNPNAGNFILQMDKVPGEALIQVYDVAGREALAQQVPGHALAAGHPLNLKGQPQGTWLLKVTTSLGVYYAKVVVY